MGEGGERSGITTLRVDLGGRAGTRVELASLRFEVVEGPDVGLVEVLFLPLIRVGAAADNDLVLTDPAVSRHHLEVRTEGGAPLLVDLGSRNGVRVGGVRVKEALLEPGQRVRLGETVLVIEEEREERLGLVEDEHRLGEMVGRSRVMRELFAEARALAPTPVTVLLRGETGTGKEAAARTLHALSGRTGPFVVFDAASTDPAMIRSDLFGHKKGAFTGAAEARDGAFRAAHGGTLFLDEVGELPLDLQPRLLRALERREVQPVGEDLAVRVDVRVIAATHRDLDEMVAAGTFREDLLHRLAVLEMTLPPLRSRLEDLPLLADHLMDGVGLRCPLGPGVEEALAAHPWPGNVRELRNVLERAAALRGGQEIRVEDLRLRAPGGAGGGRTLEDTERRRILETLERNGGHKGRTAEELGISMSNLQRRLKTYGV